jgi:hypothetical protein
MDYVQSFLGYFGLSSSVSPEEQNKGKRRTGAYFGRPPPTNNTQTPSPLLAAFLSRAAVLYMTFISFLLMIGALASADWVLGGLEFRADDNAQSSAPNSQAHFHIGLTSVQIEAYIQDIWLSSKGTSSTYNNVNSAYPCLWGSLLPALAAHSPPPSPVHSRLSAPRSLQAPALPHARGHSEQFCGHAQQCGHRQCAV